MAGWYTMMYNILVPFIFTKICGSISSSEDEGGGR